MSDNNDPRTFFAAERTLLAWVRTSLALMGMGFVVARFALFLRLLAHQQVSTPPHGPSDALGVGLIFLGALASLIAGLQHRRFQRGLPASQRPQGYWRGFAAFFAYGVAAAGLVLATFLAVGIHG
jgi:putative membrane protein